MNTNSKEMIYTWRALAMLEYLKILANKDSLSTEIKETIDNYINFLEEHSDSVPYEEKDFSNKSEKEKEYLFDSLMFRYIIARKGLAEYEFLRDTQDKDTFHQGWNSYQKLCIRDLMRFREILEEAIGEHK